MNDQQLQDWIEAYHSGELPESELSDFEARLQSDPELQKAFQSYSFIFDAFHALRASNFAEKAQNWESVITRSKSENLLKDGLQSAKALEMEQTVKDWENEKTMNERSANTSSTGKLRILMARFAVAASILLIGYWSFSFWANRNWTAEAMAVSEMQMPAGERSANVYGSSKDSILEAFRTGNYEEVKKLAEEIRKTDDNYAWSQYILGHSWFREGAYNAAAQAFARAKSIPDRKDINYELLDFQLYLSFLAGEDLKGIQAMSQLIRQTPGHAYQDELSELERKRDRVVRKLFVY